LRLELEKAIFIRGRNKHGGLDIIESTSALPVF